MSVVTKWKIQADAVPGNFLEYYRKSDGATKMKILGCIFSEKPVWQKDNSCNPLNENYCTSQP